jgi:tetratricopeptide (TPR) repeat protein
MSFESTGKFESALMLIEEALLIQENYVDAWLLKGVILGKLGKYDEALNCYDKVIELKPNSADAWRLKGAIYGTLKSYDNAAECFGKAIELDPWDIEVRLNFAYSLQKQKKFEDAIKGYEEMLKQNLTTHKYTT